MIFWGLYCTNEWRFLLLTYLLTDYLSLSTSLSPSISFYLMHSQPSSPLLFNPSACDPSTQHCPLFSLSFSIFSLRSFLSLSCTPPLSLSLSFVLFLSECLSELTGLVCKGPYLSLGQSCPIITQRGRVSVPKPDCF